MAVKAWAANAVTTEADVVAPTANKAVSIATLTLCNAGSSTASVVVKITDSSNTLVATLANPVIPAGGTYQIGGIAIPSSATPNKLRVSSDQAVSCYASGDET